MAVRVDGARIVGACVAGACVAGARVVGARVVGGAAADLDTMRPLIWGNSLVEVAKAYDELTKQQPQQYHDRFMVTVYIGVNFDMYLMSVRCEFGYLVNGEEDDNLCYGRTIEFTKKEILELGNLTHETVWQVVRKMRAVGPRPFRGIRPMYWSELMAMETEEERRIRWFLKSTRDIYHDAGRKVMALDPAVKYFAPILPGDKFLELDSAMKEMAASNPADYHERYMVLVSVGANLEKRSSGLRCEFLYFVDGRVDGTESYGHTIEFTDKDMLEMEPVGGIKDGLIWRVVKQMYRVHSSNFQTLRPIYYTQLMAMEDWMGKRVMAIVQSSDERYDGAGRHAMAVDPAAESFVPILQGNKFLALGREVKEMAAKTPADYHKRFIVLVSVGMCVEDLKGNGCGLMCEFLFFDDGIRNSANSYGHSIEFTEEDLLEMEPTGGLTDEWIWRIVKQMYQVPSGNFRTLKPVYYTQLMAMETREEREKRMEERGKRVVAILQSTRERYHDAGRRVMAVDPVAKYFVPILPGKDFFALGTAIKQMAVTDDFHERFIVLVSVGADLEKRRVQLRCEFLYFVNGKKDSIMSYGHTISFTDEDMLKMEPVGGITDDVIWRVVKQMYRAGPSNFRNLNTIFYTGLMGMKVPEMAVVIVHGGNFSGGKPSYGDALEQTLNSAGMLATCPEFPLEPHAAALAALTKCVETNRAERIVVVGMSSGGYFAARLRPHPKVAAVVYLAPVLTPALRLEFVPSKRKGTVRHFRHKDSGGKKWADPGPALQRAEEAAIAARLIDGGSTPALVFLSETDANVPPELWRHERFRAALGDAETQIVDMTHATIVKPSFRIEDSIKDWLRDLAADGGGKRAIGLKRSREQAAMQIQKEYRLRKFIKDRKEKKKSTGKE